MVKWRFSKGNNSCKASYFSLTIKNKLSAILIVICLSPAVLVSKEELSVSQENCGLSPSPIRIATRYTIGRGVGYSEGYTTFEGFFAPPPLLDNSWIPFLDARGHVFNNGKFAVNAGLGVRYLNSRVWGINAYYDYRNTVHQHYNQVSLGLESLGITWDFRINGYLPVGDKKSPFYDIQFDSFLGNELLVSLKQEFAMKGANAEVGAHITKMENAQLYAALGPYYFQNEGKRSWGGEGRLVFEAYKHIRLQVNGSYDSLFKGIIQGEVGIFFAFGPRKEIRTTKVREETGFFPFYQAKKEAKKAEESACHDEMLLRERALQRVDRNEIIVLDKKREKAIALDPNGGSYSFLFVDNTSHSNGTFESPFNTLFAAESNSGPGDIIYVFPGDGTSTGMDSGITLQDSQRLLGASTPHQIDTIFGTITIPPLAKTAPLLTNAMISGQSTVNLANNNEVSGFTIHDVNGVPYTAGISLLSGTNATITQNTVITIVDADAIEIGDPTGASSVSPSGIITIANNRIQGGDTGDTYGVQVSGGNMSITIQGNTFSGIDGSTGLTQGVNAATVYEGLIDMSIIGNVFNSAESIDNGDTIAAIFIYNQIDSPQTVSIIGNQIGVPQVSPLPTQIAGLFAELIPAMPSVTMYLNVIDNVANTGSVTGYQFMSTPSSAMQVNFSQNVGSRTGP